VCFVSSASCKLATDGDRVPDSYIVQFKANISESTLSAFIDRMTNVHKITPIRNWSIGTTFRAVALENTEEEIQSLLSEDAHIEFIEENKKMSFGEITETQQSCVTQNALSWGLARLTDGEAISPNQEFTYPSSSGVNVHSYIVDTGIRITHREFAGRATWGANFVDTQNTDCNGHGTHVAGTVGGTQYGVAKRTNLVAVKVLNCAGSGTNIGVIDGVDFVASDCATKGRRCNANMSLGGGRSTALNNAVTAVVSTGIPFAVAAGNENRDANLVSPASAPGALCVGATALAGSGGSENQYDQRSSFSNFGPILAIFAPGSAITAAWSTSDTAINTISGTSMASPHVAGVLSLLQGDSPNSSPAQLRSSLISTAVNNVITLSCTSTICNNSPNRMLHVNC